MHVNKRERKNNPQRLFAQNNLCMERLERRYALSAAPILDPTADPALQPVEENAPPPAGVVGTLVSTLIAENGAVANYTSDATTAEWGQPGIAITGINHDNGVLWASTDGGQWWEPITHASNESPWLHIANSETRLYYQPVPGFSGTIHDAIRFTAWNGDGAAWNHAGNVTDDGISDYGRSVEISGDGKTVVSVRYGRTNVRRYVDGAWQPLGSEIRYGGSATVTYDGNTIVLGDTSDTNKFGGVRVYQWNGDAWQQQGDEIQGTKRNQNFGYDVSLSSDATTLAVLSKGYEVWPECDSQLDLYSRNGSGWVHQATAIPPAPGDLRTLSMSGDAGTMVVTKSSRQVTVLTRESDDAPWEQTVWSDVGTRAELSEDGSVLVIGNRNWNSNAGIVRTYQRRGDNWIDLGKIQTPGQPDYFGTNVKLSASGTSLAVASDTAVRVYRFTGYAWEQVGSDIPKSERPLAFSADGRTLVKSGTAEGTYFESVFTLGAAADSVSVASDTIAANVKGPANQRPVAVSMQPSHATLAAETDLSARRRLAAINVNDDGLGNTVLTLTGPDAAYFSIADGSLYLKAGVELGPLLGRALSVTVSAHDSTAPAANVSREFTLTVTPRISSPPLLDVNKAVFLSAVVQDSGTPVGQVGTPVAELIDKDGPLSNFIGTGVAGIAVVGLRSADTELWFSTDNGASWTNVLRNLSQHPLYLAADATTRVYVRPPAGFLGSLTDVLTFRAWDATSYSESTVPESFEGSAVSLSADGLTLAVGREDRCKVSIYRKRDGEWVWEQDLRGETDGWFGGGDRFGCAVALSNDGSRLVVGAFLHDNANGENAGRAVVYDRSEANGRWVQVAGDILGEDDIDYAGYGVAISGDGSVVVVKNRVYVLQGGAWQKLGDAIGYWPPLREYQWRGSVALSNDGMTIAIGNPKGGWAERQRGSVQVYRWNEESASWQEIAYIEGEVDNDGVGKSVALSADGNTLAVGSKHGRQTSELNSGAVHVYRLHDSQAVSVGQELTGTQSAETFGYSLTLSADGKTLAVSAQTDFDGESDVRQGAIYFFRWNGSGWQQGPTTIVGSTHDRWGGRESSLIGLYGYNWTNGLAITGDGLTLAVGSATEDVKVVELPRLSTPLSDAVGTLDINVVANQPPSAVSLSPPARTLPESTPTESRVKLADIRIEDDGGGTNIVDIVQLGLNDDGTAADLYEVVGSELFLKAGVSLDAGKPAAYYRARVLVRDAGFGDVVDCDFQLTVTAPRGLESVLTFGSDGYWRLAKSDGAAFTQSTFAYWSTGVEWDAVVQGDFNGDGLDDVAGRTHLGQWWSSINQGDGTAAAPDFMIYWKPSLNITEYVSGDFNGDGRTDVAGISSTGVWWGGLARTDTIGFTNTRMGAWSSSLSFTSIQTGDFDGDGRTDIAGLTTTGQWFGLLGKTGGGWQTVSLGYWSPSLNFTDAIVTGDFNGDGRTDIAGRTQAGQWWAAVTTAGTVGFTNALIGGWSTSVTWQSVNVGDFNGDGMADIIARASNGQWWGLLSDGTDGLRTNTHIGYWNPNVVWTGIVTGDADGDGRDDLIGRVATTYETARGRLWVAKIVDGALMQTSKWGFQTAAEQVAARNIFFAGF